MSQTGPQKNLDLLERLQQQIRRLKKRQRKPRYTDHAAWRPPRKRKFRNFRGQIARLNRILSSPSKNVVMLTEQSIGIDGGLDLRTLQDLQLSTPTKGVETTSLRNSDFSVVRVRTIESQHGKISIFLDRDKVETTAVVPPEPPVDLEEKLAQTKMNRSQNHRMDDIEISLKTLKTIQGAKRENFKLYSSDRKPTNRQATKFSANDLAKMLGMEGQDWQWWHMIGHSLWGDDSQTMDNFVLGKMHGNSKMNDLAESLIKCILKQMKATEPNPKLYLSAEVEWVKGYEAARLPQKLIWTLKDGKGYDYTRMVRFSFNPLSTANLCESEIDITKKALFHLFMDDKKVVLRTPVRSARAHVAHSPAKMQRKPLDFGQTSPQCKKSLLHGFDHIKVKKEGQQGQKRSEKPSHRESTSLFTQPSDRKKPRST